jgi:hypothetical protein
VTVVAGPFWRSASETILPFVHYSQKVSLAPLELERLDLQPAKRRVKAAELVNIVSLRIGNAALV